MIGVFSILVTAAELMSYFDDPRSLSNGDRGFFTIVAGLLWWLGHGVWLSMDRRRRGLESGWWRYGVIFLGPVAIWLYLILEYRTRALYLIPLSLAIYLGIGFAIASVVLIATQLTQTRRYFPGPSSPFIGNKSERR